MDYSKYILTTMNTAEASATETRITLSRGIINGGFIYFPSGPAGLLHVQLFVRGIQIAPANRGDSYNLDDAVIPLALFYPLDDPPYQLIIKTWNVSSTYDHACTVAFWLKEVSSLSAPAALSTKKLDDLVNQVKARNYAA